MIDISITSRQRSRADKPRLKQDVIDSTLAAVERAVETGARCPLNSGAPNFGPVSTGALTQLANDGVLRIEIFFHNFRRVTMLTGRLAGKHTAHPPSWPSVKPYKVIP